METKNITIKAKVSKKDLLKTDDFNFNGYTHQQLNLLCKYKVPLKTHYPKLVVIIFLNPKFKHWLRDNDIYTQDEECIINLIILAINSVTIDTYGNLKFKEIDLFNDKLWINLVEIFLKEKINGTFVKRVNKKSKKKQRVFHV